MRHAFEHDVWATLEFIPLSVRRKLDLAGIKISLAAWQALPREERERLCEVPVDGDDASTFREEVTRAVGHFDGQVTPLPEPVDPRTYRGPAARDAVLARAASLGIHCDPSRWDVLDDDGRYALVRLGDPRKREEKFKSALFELGLAPDPPGEP